jgi:hypothetical protein
MWSEPVSPADELESLKRQAEYFEKSLGDIQQRIEELQSEDKKS